ncbi:hypothetical protein HK100_006596 [Physocladia obscura]|uniref:Protein kinase domain-containing protein n=1 Tax=Physocladia obscura TaxID=109957 RepID=A0AAD5T671_9FUNG|nr:hypothetical protein HK100_006596 [Physocladia obscura]
MLKWLGVSNGNSTVETQEPIGSGGPGGNWRVYSGRRRADGAPVAVFVAGSANAGAAVGAAIVRTAASRDAAARDRDETCAVLLRDAQIATRLRHPGLLAVVEPPVTGQQLVFASEPLRACLADLLTQGPRSDSSRSDIHSDNPLDIVDITRGLLSLLSALQFLHSNSWVHVGLAPDAVYINAKGDWKLAGFAFSQNASSAFSLGNYPPFCSPDLDFLAPECAMDAKCSAASDIWSLACLIFAVFNRGKPPISSNQNSHIYSTRIRQLEDPKFFDPYLNNVPAQLHSYLPRMMTRDPSRRLTLSEFCQSPFFENILVSTLAFLDAFVEKSSIDKAQFLKGLVKVLDKEFSTIIMPALKPIFKMTDPPQAIILLLSRMDIFTKKCTSSEAFKQDIMPLLYGALEINVPQVQEQAIKTIPQLTSKLDFTSVKSVLFPKVQNLYLSSPILSIRVAALIAIHSMLKVLDKFTIVEKVVPLLKQNKIHEQPALLVAILAVYDEVAKYVDKDAVAGEILPELWRMAVNRVLNIKQFNKFMGVIHALTARVESEHTKFLEETKSLESQHDPPREPDAPGQISSFTTLVSDSHRRSSIDSTNRSSSSAKVLPISQDGWDEFDAPTRNNTVPISWIKPTVLATASSSSITPPSATTSTRLSGVNNNSTPSRNQFQPHASATFAANAEGANVPKIAPPPAQQQATLNSGSKSFLPQQSFASFPQSSNTSFSNTLPNGLNNGNNGWQGGRNSGSGSSIGGVGSSGMLVPMTVGGGARNSKNEQNSNGNVAKRNAKLNEFDPFS